MYPKRNSPRTISRASPRCNPISEDLKRGAIKATIFAILIIFVYIFIRFRDWRYSVGTIFTLLHDVFVTLAVFSFCKNIVPVPARDRPALHRRDTDGDRFLDERYRDRVRPYPRIQPRYERRYQTTIINRADQRYAEPYHHDLTDGIPHPLILFIFGGEVTRGFAFAMLIGVITGTYSSYFRRCTRTGGYGQEQAAWRRRRGRRQKINQFLELYKGSCHGKTLLFLR